MTASRDWHRSRAKVRYEETAEKLRQYKLEQGCMDCGYNAHHAGLELDHREGRQGRKTISQYVSNGWNAVLRELELCDVVCAICHNIRTFERGQQARGLGAARATTPDPHRPQYRGAVLEQPLEN